MGRYITVYTKHCGWIARVYGNPPTTLIQTDTGQLYIKHFTHPDILTIATWIRNRPGVYRVGVPDPVSDTKTTRKYVEYRFMVFPF